MRKYTTLKTALLATVAVGLTGASTFGATIFEDFETSSGSTPPAGWSVVNADGEVTPAVYSTETGSNGSGGSSGLAGQVATSTVFATDLPSGYLVNTTAAGVFDLNHSLTISFDMMIVQEGTFDDVAIVVGDVADGLSKIAGEAFTVKFAESVNSSGEAHAINDGIGIEAGRLDTASLNGVVDDTWYRATITWTPTSGLTGDINVTLNNFASDIVTLSATGFTFDANNAEVGFGSVNDKGRFDNVSITGTTTVIPEPASLAMGMAGLVMMMARRRR